MLSLVSSSVSTDCPAKRPADFTSTTRPSTSADVGMTISSFMVTGAEIDPRNTSPTFAFSEFTSSLRRMLSCVPAGMVIFCGGGGVTGAGGALDWAELLSLFAGTVVRKPLSPLLLPDGREVVARCVLGEGRRSFVGGGLYVDALCSPAP